MNENLDIAARLKAARRAAGFSTARAFCQAFNIPKSTFGQHEKGQRIPKDRMLKEYAKHLEVNFIWLKTGEGDAFAGQNPNKTALIHKEVNKETLANQLAYKRDEIPSLDEEFFANLIEKTMIYLEKNNIKFTHREFASTITTLYQHIRKAEKDPKLQNLLIDISLDSYFHFYSAPRAE
ncbi:MAG: hypothetical protein HKM04_06190 [Legionellales bacterium]|nr:hypothetical protein [Legionellales bacterium]